MHSPIFQWTRERWALAGLLLVSLVLTACQPGPQRQSVESSRTPSPNRMSQPTAPVLFDFHSAELDRWQVVNDGVMGGRSQGFIEITDEGHLRFTGKLVTQGGGFTSVRGQRKADLAGYTGIELRVRGGGRTFELDVSDGSTYYGRNISRRAAFPTEQKWQTVRLPFAALRTSVRGRPVEVDPLAADQVKSIGFFIVDGIDGPFELEVDWIRAY